MKISIYVPDELWETAEEVAADIVDDAIDPKISASALVQQALTSWISSQPKTRKERVRKRIVAKVREEAWNEAGRLLA